MKLLLDTRAFLWAVLAPAELSPRMRRLLTDSSNSVSVSAVSFWEIAIKAGLGKLTLTGLSPDDLPAAAAAHDIHVLALEGIDAASSRRLPRGAHKDPFDRMIIWQAMRHQLTLVSKDTGILAYRDQGLQVQW